MVKKPKIMIREFQSKDLDQVSNLLAFSFIDDYNKIVSLPEDQLINFIVEAGEVPLFPFPGYLIVEENGVVVAVMILRWPKQNAPRSKFKLSRILNYGLLTTFKVLVMRYLFSWDNPKKGTCHVAVLAVKLNTRRRGIATKLLEYGKEFAINKGLNKYTLNVDVTNNGAVDLYKKAGFQIIKMRRNMLAKWLFDEDAWYYMGQSIDSDT